MTLYDPELKSQLAAPTYKFDAAGRKVLEPKEKIKERGLKSPDMADALALTFAANVISRDDYMNKDYIDSYANDYDPFARL